MFLFYVDESGTPGGWNDQDNFVLGGVAVHEGQVWHLSEELVRIQQQFFPDIQVPLEFHASHIYNGKGRFRVMGPGQRMALLDAAYDVISNAGFPNLVAFVTAIHVSAVESDNQALGDCLEDLCDCFNAFLVRGHKRGRTNKGLLIMDRSGREKAVRQLMYEFKCQGTRRGYLGNIVDVPYFADSSHTRMLQLADLVAFAGGRYFNRNDSTYLDKILSQVARYSSRGKIVGLKHITRRDHQCNCIALH